MNYNLRAKAKTFRSEARLFLRNLETLIQATALIYAPLTLYLALTKKVDLATLNVAGRYAAFGSVIVIAYLGAIQLAKFLDNK